ncbi:hypothetical protein Dsin_001455 [Dipteronia sinensis]|uniref:Uncharacterized protein n=1 Tax=Dipteronia sinensis TaxID=43782 RepID=A0AAE0B5E6_9ROSI|nr:hypothetical protein Dsin_001455 [Dipteronia sinensis]
MAVGRLATPGELNMEPPSTFKSEARQILFDNPTSNLSYQDVKNLEFKLVIPEKVNLQATAPFECADWSIQSWTCFYYLPFKLGIRLPIPPLARQLLNFFEIALSQLMPNGLRILLSLKVLIERQKLDLSFENLMYTYYLKEHDTDCGRYLVAARHHRGHLISELKTRDPDWKPKFFFGQGDLVNRVRSIWNNAGNPCPRLEDMTKYVWISYGFKILCGTQFLEPVTDVERASGTTTMSNLKLLSSKEALKRQMERIDMKNGEECRQCPSPLDFQTNREVIKFPSGVSVYSDLGSTLKQADQLLFPEDEAHLSKIGTSQAVHWALAGAYQTHLFLRKDVKSLSKKVSSLTSFNAKMKKELKESSDKDVKVWERWKELKALDVDDDDEDEDRNGGADVKLEKEAIGRGAGDDLEGPRENQDQDS